MATNWQQFFTGTPGGFQQIPNFTQNQQNAMNQVLGYSLPKLTTNNFDFGPIAENARKNYWEKSAPLISERFAGSGALGSSAYRNALQGGAADLESQLAAQQANYGLQQQSQLQNLLSIGLTPQFDTAHQQAEPGLLQAAAPYAGQIAGQVIPQLVGAGMSALGGAAQGAGQRMFGGGGSGTAMQPMVNNAANFAGQVAGNVAPTAAVAGASALAPAAKAALGGLTAAGKFILPLGAAAALGVGGYFLYNALKNRWEKRREATALERQNLERLYSGTPEEQRAAGLIPLPSNYQQQRDLGYIRPMGPQVQPQRRIVCNNGMCRAQ